MSRLRDKFGTVSILCLVTLLCKSADGFLLDLFSEKDRHGLSIRLDVSEAECSNLPAPWSSRASSINTLGSCVQLYDEGACKGKLTIIQPFHTIHQMDLSLINFANSIQSASSCGPKIKTGRFVIQNAQDASILTVTSKYGGFARAFTTNSSKVITKAQQWDIIELSNSEYSLKPREFGDNYPVSYDEEFLKKGQIKKKLWKLMSVGRGRYLLKNEPSQKCLYKTEDRRVEEHDCRIWSPNQEWVMKEIFGNPKPTRSSSAVGPGYNYNILSKVASFVPPSKPLPEFAPIFHNVSTLPLKPRSTAAPYIIRKKIRRGPRPKTRPVQQLMSLNVRPPGLRERPALSEKFSNNNKFLLEKNPGKVGNMSGIREFVPSDDRVETYQYYQQVLQANAQQYELIRQAQEQALRNKGKPLLPPPGSKKKKNDKENDDEDSDEDRENDDDDSDEDKKKKRKKVKEVEEDDEKRHDEEDERDEDEEGEEQKKRRRRKKKQQKEEDDEDGDSDEDDDDDGKKKKPSSPPPPTRRPYSPYVDINYSSTNLTAEANKGFFKSVLTNLKSMVPIPKIPFLSGGSDNNATSQSHQGQGFVEQNPPHYYMQKPEQKRPEYPGLYRPQRPHDEEKRPDRPQRPRPQDDEEEKPQDDESEESPSDEIEIEEQPQYDDRDAEGPPKRKRRPRPPQSDDKDRPPRPQGDYPQYDEGGEGPRRRPRPPHADEGPQSDAEDRPPVKQRPRPRPQGDGGLDDYPFDDSEDQGPPPPKRKRKRRPPPPQNEIEDYEEGPPRRPSSYSSDGDEMYEGPPPPQKEGPRPGLRLPKRKSSTTTTTEKSTLWGLFG